MLVSSIVGGKSLNVFGSNASVGNEFVYSVATKLHITELALRGIDLYADIRDRIHYVPNYDPITKTVLNASKKLIVFIKSPPVLALPSIDTFNGGSGIYTYTKNTEHVIHDFKLNHGKDVIVIDNKYIVKSLVKSDNIYLETAKLVVEIHKLPKVNLYKVVAFFLSIATFLKTQLK